METPDLDAAFGTSKPFEYWLNDPTNPIVYCLLQLDGKDFLAKNGYTVELIQKTADHDTFCITVSDDALDSFQGYLMEHSKKLLGKSLSITFHHRGKPRHTFEGIIGGVTNKKDNGSGYGKLHITGYSPSILLESGKHCQSFENKTLEQIISEITAEYPREAKIKTDIPNTRHSLPYTVQYKESDYQFIRRMAIRHGEFFYYTGRQLTFGTGVQPIIRLGQGIDLKDIDFEMKTGAQDFKYIGYDAQSGSKIEKDSSSIQSEFKESLFQSIAVNDSKKLFSKKPNMHFNHTGISPVSGKELEEAVRLEKERREHLVQVRGKSDNPELKIGGRAELTDINVKPMETFRIIEIRHYHSGIQYYNEFVGIPDYFNAAHYIDTEAVPKGEEQPARVTDNNDPMGMGRVRVQFPWQEDKNQMTPWIRLIQPHSGSGKGFHFIPEIGEEVLVGHESGNAEKPFVMGTHYNGSEKSSYHTAGNDLKVIKTRSGIEQIFNDAEGSWKQSTPDGNFLHFDGQGNATLNVPNDLTLNVGGNFNINVGKNVSFLVGLRAIYNIGLQMMMNTPILKYFVSDNYHLQSPKTLINGEGEIKIEAKETQVAGFEKLFVHSNESAVINSKGVVEVKGQDGTSNTNTPTNYEMTRPEITAKCIVHFRPKKDWKGIGYGFDYMRKGDTSLLFGSAEPGDADYETIVSKQYTDTTYAALVTDINEYRKSFKKDSAQYSSLKNDYNVHNIPWRAKKDAAGAELKDSAGNTIPEEYFCSWLSLYPHSIVDYNLGKKLEGKPVPPTIHSNCKAILSLIVDIEEEPEMLRFEDNEYFEISPKEIEVKGKGKGKHAFADHVTITCLKEFSSDQTLVVNAITKDEAGNQTLLPAGKILVWANNSAKIKKAKILLIDVRTPAISSTVKKNGDISGQKSLFNSYLKQALIDTEVATENLDLSTDTNLQAGGTYIHNNLIKAYYDDAVTPPAGFKTIQEYVYEKLKDQLKSINPADENKYDSYYIMVYFGENGGKYMSAGYIDTVAGYSSGKYVVMFSGKTPQTGTHELLHSFNLPHSFSNKECIGVIGNVFTYQYAQTENILDYSHRQRKPRYSLWHWQWIKANNSIR